MPKKIMTLQEFRSLSKSSLHKLLNKKLSIGRLKRMNAKTILYCMGACSKRTNAITRKNETLGQLITRASRQRRFLPSWWIPHSVIPNTPNRQVSLADLHWMMSASTPHKYWDMQNRSEAINSIQYCVKLIPKRIRCHIARAHTYVVEYAGCVHFLYYDEDDINSILKILS